MEKTVLQSILGRIEHKSAVDLITRWGKHIVAMEEARDNYGQGDVLGCTYYYCDRPYTQEEVGFVRELHVALDCVYINYSKPAINFGTRAITAFTLY